MGLEATMIIVDNSEWSRNEDYEGGSRWEVQADAVNTIFSQKTADNPESAVGLMTMGPRASQTAITPTTEAGRILSGLKLFEKDMGGKSQFSTAISIAALYLKHRQNKSQRQRIVVFNCSPLQESEKEMTQLAKRMKKNNISVDVVAFGELSDEVTSKLDAFKKAVEGGDGSHVVKISPGSGLLSDSIQDGNILPDNKGLSAAAGRGGDDFDFGADPAEDPELALALKMSLEDEKARIEKEKREREAQEGKTELGDIPEGDEKQPLLSKDGSASKKDGKDDDGDKMDTA